jgi:hypothetical protein
MQERHQLCFGLRLVSKEFQHPAIQTQNRQHFGGFLHQIKVIKPIGFYANRDLIKQEVGWIHFCLRRLRTLKSFQIFKSEIKKSKTYSG